MWKVPCPHCGHKNAELARTIKCGGCKLTYTPGSTRTSQTPAVPLRRVGIAGLRKRLAAGELILDTNVQRFAEELPSGVADEEASAEGRTIFLIGRSVVYRTAAPRKPYRQIVLGSDRDAKVVFDALVATPLPPDLEATIFARGTNRHEAARRILSWAWYIPTRS